MNVNSLENIKHIHLIGIGGTGLSAIAKVLHESGYIVSGSDQQNSRNVQNLRKMGVHVNIGHSVENVRDADLVVRSSAIPDYNVEVEAALNKGISVVKRREFLNKLIGDKKTIAIAGTHGKTTTTSMIAWMLFALGKDPSFIIGSPSKNLKENAHAGKGAYFVIEADEYDHMFLGLHPNIAVVLNMEYDHPDCFPTIDDYEQDFAQFAGSIVPGGLLLYNGNAPNVVRMVDNLNLQKVKPISINICESVYLSEKDRHLRCDYQAENLSINEHGCYDFYFSKKNTGILTGVSLRVPGIHNVFDAVAALAVADLLHLSILDAALAIGNFIGTERRFEIRGEKNGVIIIDDYAHHPTEIKTTLRAAKERFSNRKIWVVWQPHTFSRTQALYNDFVQSFVDADHLIVTDIYAARETRESNSFGAEKIASAIKIAPQNRGLIVEYIPDLQQVIKYLKKELVAGDVLLILSAGDANQISDALVGMRENDGSFKEKTHV